MPSLPIPSPILSLNLFPDSIENDKTIFYHGTSDIYSDQIESFGLFPNHKPLTSYFYELLRVADEITWHTQGNREYENFNQIKSASLTYFKSFLRTSLTPVSICAAKYSIGDTSGGQGLRHLIRLEEAISSCYPILQDDINISDIQEYHLNNFRSEINKIKNSDGVVYAIKFEKSDIINLSYERVSYHGVLHSTNHIPPTKIVAKMIIPNQTNLPNDLANRGNEKTLSLHNLNSDNEFIREIIIANTKRERNEIQETIQDEGTI